MMVARCVNRNIPSWENYGGRGITICDRWLKFEDFLADMGPKPSNGYSIDRIDVNGNYEPGNCRWATIHEQSRNKRTNRFIEWNGRTQIVSDWAKELGMSTSLLEARLGRLGWPLDKAMTTPVKRRPNAQVQSPVE